MVKQLLFSAFVLLCAQMQAQSLPANRLILKFKNTPAAAPEAGRTGHERIDEQQRRFNPLKTERFRAGKDGDQFFYVITFPEGTDLKAVAEADLRTGALEFAEPDGIGSCAGVQGVTPNDPNFYRQWSLKNNGTFSLSPAVAGADIEMENAWAIEQGDPNIIVTIIDSGAKLTHTELSGRIWTNTAEIAGNGVDDDNNGKVDDVNGWDYANDDNNPTDDLGHGTNVTGIIGANGNNNKGYAGVDWNCKLMILKAINSNNFGYYSWWANALYYAVDNGARVVNMSLGGSTASSLLESAVNYALSHNVVVVVSMMNFNNNVPYYPAAVPGVIAVGSTNPNDYRTHPFFWDVNSGSNYGNHISVAAPGNYIYGLHYQTDANYGTYWGGTSQAAPHVAGLASLLLAQKPTRTPAEIRAVIENTAEDQVGDPAEDLPGWDPFYGYGRVNAYKALSVATSTWSAEKQALNFNIMPNPAGASFRILRTETGPVTYRLFNMLGQCVYEIRTEEIVAELRPGLKPGVYQVLAQAGGKTGTSTLMIASE